MKTIALIEKGKDGTFGIFTPDLNSTIIGEGATVAEAKADFENSAKEVISSYEADELPEELRNVQFAYKYDLASFFDNYPILNISRLAKSTGINVSLMHQYKAGQYISEKQLTKIENELHKLGNELAAIQLV